MLLLLPLLDAAACCCCVGEQSQLRKMYHAYDADSNGVLELKEFQGLIQTCTPDVLPAK